MGNSVEYISCNYGLFSYSQGRAESGCIASPVLSKGRQRGGANFSSQYHRNFMVNKIQLKQIYCSYSRTHNTQNRFLHSLPSFLRSTLLLNRNKHIGEECFVFYKFEFQLNSFTDPCPTVASAATCVLCNSTCKLIISTDMIIEIQIIKLLTKLLTESHWRQIFSRLKSAHLNHISFLIK